MFGIRSFETVVHSSGCKARVPSGRKDHRDGSDRRNDRQHSDYRRNIRGCDHRKGSLDRRKGVLQHTRGVHVHDVCLHMVVQHMGLDNTRPTRLPL